MRNRKKGKIITITVLGIITALLFGAGILYAFSTPEPNEIQFDTNAVSGGIPEENKQSVQKDLNQQVADGMINISMNQHPIFSEAGEAGTLMIVNESINQYPQVIEIYLTDTNELIYKSGALPVGKKIESAKLSTKLAPGDYNCVAYFSSVNVETGETLGKAGADITISVLA